MKENEYRKALNTLITSDIKLHVYKNQDGVDINNQPSIFDFYHHELLILDKLVNEYEKQSKALDNACSLLEKNVTKREHHIDDYGEFDLDVPIRTKGEWRKFIMLNWEVYYYDINKRKIRKYNVFNHVSFYKSLKKIIKEAKYKCDLKEKVKTELIYYFWSKYEWELIVRDVGGSIKLYPLGEWTHDSVEAVDVTNDTSLDWKKFAKEHINECFLEKEAKIDAFNQIHFRYDEFIDYLVENKELFI